MSRVVRPPTFRSNLPSWYNTSKLRIVPNVQDVSWLDDSGEVPNEHCIPIVIYEKPINFLHDPLDQTVP